MALTKFPIDYIKIAKDREKRTLAMTSVHEIAFGISPLDKRKYKRNRQLWCYNTKALQAVGLWLNMLHDNGYLYDGQFKSLNNDCQRVIRVLISIVKTCSQKLKK